MKHLIIIISIIFTLPSICYGEWSYIGKNTSGVEFYVDYKNLKKKGDNLLFWQLLNRKTPDRWGSLSSSIYKELNCKQNTYRLLTFRYYYQSMGKNLEKEDKSLNNKWQYNTPNTMNEKISKFICKLRYKKSGSSSKLEKYTSFCEEIGFKPGTEKFGECVMKAMEKE